MKKLIIVLLLIPFTLSSQWEFKLDKGLHTGIGFTLAIPSLALLYNATNEWEGSINATILLVTVAATGKETFDMLKQIATNKGNGYDWADWSYTIIGGAIGILITRYFIKRKKRKFDKKFSITFI